MSYEELSICEEAAFNEFQQINNSTAFTNQDTGAGFYAFFGKKQRERERVVAQRRIKGGIHCEC